MKHQEQIKKLKKIVEKVGLVTAFAEMGYKSYANYHVWLKRGEITGFGLEKVDRLTRKYKKLLQEG